MERPIYSNAFSVTYNPNLGEFILNFAIEYPSIPNPNESGVTESKAERDNICGIVLPKATAIQLTQIITDALANTQDNE